LERPSPGQNKATFGLNMRQLQHKGNASTRPQ
jgi:hypothetical protein